MTDSTPINVAGHRNRVKQKLMINGGDGFADYELLELLLMIALPRRDVKPIAKELLRKFGSFAETIYAPENKLREVKWVKDNVISLFMAVRAANKRICHDHMCDSDKPVLLNTETVIDYARSIIGYCEVEEFWVIFLDASLQLIDSVLVQRGTLTSVAVSPREVVRLALDKNSPNIILIHNHPSDKTNPSDNDIKMTRKIKEACELMSIALQEHLIIGKTNYYSFRNHNLL